LFFEARRIRNLIALIKINELKNATFIEEFLNNSTFTSLFKCFSQTND